MPGRVGQGSGTQATAPGQTTPTVIMATLRSASATRRLDAIVEQQRNALQDTRPSFGLARFTPLLGTSR